jgi:hypothetical protein
MNRMKHYHLGCGESLQSGWTELRILRRNDAEETVKQKPKNLATTKPGKQH